MSDRVVIEVVKNNGQVQYSMTKSNDNNLNQLGEVAVGAMGAFIKHGNNPQGLLEQALPMIQNMMGGNNGGGGGGFNMSNLLGGLMGGK